MSADANSYTGGETRIISQAKPNSAALGAGKGVMLPDSRKPGNKCCECSNCASCSYAHFTHLRMSLPVNFQKLHHLGPRA